MGNTCTTCWHRYVSVFEHFLVKYFRKWGAFVSRNPLATLIGSLVFTLFGSLFMLNMQSETETHKLYAPQTTQTWANFEKYQKTWELYEDQKRFNHFIISAKHANAQDTDTTDNLYTLQILQRLLLIHEGILSITVEYDQTTYAFEDICFRYENDHCIVGSILEFFDFDENILSHTFFDYDAQIASNNGSNVFDYNALVSDVINRNNKTIIGYPLAYSVYSGNYAFLLTILGSPIASKVLQTRDPTTYLPVVYSTPAYGCSYILDQSLHAKELLLLWEEKYLEYISTASATTTATQFQSAISYSAANSFNSELLRAVASDSTSFVLAFLLLSVFSGFVLVRCKRKRKRTRTHTHNGDAEDDGDDNGCILCRYEVDHRRSRSIMSVVGIVSSALAVATSFGIVGGIFGVKFNSVVSIAPFLLVGLGLDDAFVLLRSYELTPMTDSIEKRMMVTMERGGVSILFTSVTDLLAFCVGASSAFGSVSAFCVYCGVGVFMDFVFQITFFLAFMVYDSRWQMHGCCCRKEYGCGYSKDHGCCYGCCAWKTATKVVDDDAGHGAGIEMTVGDTTPVDSTATATAIATATVATNDAKTTTTTTPTTTTPTTSAGAMHESRDFSKEEISKLQNIPSLKRRTTIGFNTKLPYMISPASESIIMRKWGMFLLRNNWIKAVVLVLFVVYLVIAGIGISTLTAKQDPRDLAPRDSYLLPYYVDLENYFNELGRQMMFSFNKPLDYSDVETLDSIERFTQTVENSSCFSGSSDYTRSWIRAYQTYLQNENYDLVGNSSFFYDNLFSQYLISDAGLTYRQDVWETVVADYKSLSESDTSSYSVIAVNDEEDAPIQRSRIFISMKPTGTGTQIIANCIGDFKKLTNDFPELSVYYFEVLTLFAESDLITIEQTTYNLIYACCAALLITMVLIPYPLMSLFVMTTVGQILFGVMGYMSLWGMDINTTTLINVVTSVGFSVDNAAHFCHSFMNAPINKIPKRLSIKEERNSRVLFALNAVGMPILAGDISTILALLPLAAAESEIFTSFFKVLFLVMVFGVCHAVIYLPVVLSLIGPTLASKGEQTKADEKEHAMALNMALKSGSVQESADEVEDGDGDGDEPTVLKAEVPTKR